MLTGLASGEDSRGSQRAKQDDAYAYGAMALMALILTITVMVAPKSMRQTVVTDIYGADYLVLNPEMD